MLCTPELFIEISNRSCIEIESQLNFLNHKVPRITWFWEKNYFSVNAITDLVQTYENQMIHLGSYIAIVHCHAKLLKDLYIAREFVKNWDTIFREYIPIYRQ